MAEARKPLASETSRKVAVMVMFDTYTVKEAIAAVDLYERSPSLLVGDNLWVYGSSKALSRAQAYILSNSGHPVERKDINRYLANELKLAEAKLVAAHEEIAILQSQLKGYKRYGR